MTETLLQQVEDKMLRLVAEIGATRTELQQLRQENMSLRAEQANHAGKLQGLISLLDSMDSAYPSLLPESHEEYARA